MPRSTDPPLDDALFLFDSLPDKLYYFAYGANMNSLQMLKRCSGPKVAAIARLHNYRLEFFGHSSIWDGGQESVIRAPSHYVWGVVYEMSPMDMEQLDAWQDVRMDGTGLYFHYPARVNGADGRTYTVLLYKKDILGAPRKPSQPYLDFIIMGAAEKELPAEYLDGLRVIEAKPASYPVPKLRTFNPESLLAWDCSKCSE